MEKDNNFLATEPIGKLLFKLAVPTLTAQLINMLYNLVDRIYIGRIPDVGALALTGVGVCLPVTLLVSACASLFGSGGAPRASIFMGKNDKATAERILGNAFTALLMISAILTTILLIFGRKLLLIFGASDNTIDYAVGYLSIYAIGTVFVQTALGLNMFITAQGYTRVSMLSVLLGAVSNIILDPIFIFGFGMGVKGAALATILSQALSAIWIVYFLIGKKTQLRIKPANMRLSKDIILPSMALGLAPFIMHSTESATVMSFNSSLLKYGGDIAVGAMTICSSVMQFSMLPLQGLSQGAQPITGYNFGAGNTDRVKKVFKTLLISCLVYSTALWLLVMVAPQMFAGIFTPDAALIEYSKSALRIYMAVSLIFGAQIACQMTFVAIGSAKESVVVAIVRKVVLLIPLIFILPMFLQNKTDAVYMAEPVADLIAVSFTVILFSKRFTAALSKCKKPQDV